jgi:Ras family
VDLVKEREVPEERAVRFAEENGMHLLETSALTVVNVHEAFFLIASQIKERISREESLKGV